MEDWQWAGLIAAVTWIFILVSTRGRAGSYRMSELNDVQTTVGVIDGLRARIAELEARIKRDEKYRDELLYSRAECVERAEQAEATVAERNLQLVTALDAEAKIAAQRDGQAEATIERLKWMLGLAWETIPENAIEEHKGNVRVWLADLERRWAERGGE